MVHSHLRGLTEHKPTLSDPENNMETDFCRAEQWEALAEHTEDALSLLIINSQSTFHPNLPSYFDNKVEV